MKMLRQIPDDPIAADVLASATSRAKYNASKTKNLKRSNLGLSVLKYFFKVQIRSCVKPRGATWTEWRARASPDDQLYAPTRWSVWRGVSGAQVYGSICARRSFKMGHGRKQDPVVWILGVHCLGERFLPCMFQIIWPNIFGNGPAKSGSAPSSRSHDASWMAT
jgi:hypothetical protein